MRAPHHLRQRRVELLLDARAILARRRQDGGSAADRLMQIARLDRFGGAARQGLHLVDQLGDAVHLLGDQRGHRQFRPFGLARQQLRRTLDAGQRILDLMRQNFRRAQKAILAARNRVAHRFGGGAIMQGEHPPAGRIDDWRHRHVQPPHRLAHHGHIHLPGRQRPLAGAKPGHQPRCTKA